MSEKILKALMQLFAIIAQSEEDNSHSREVVELFLKQQLNKNKVVEYLAIYDEFLRSQNIGVEGEKRKRRLAVSSVKVIVICNQINEALTQKQKFIVLLNLIDFVSSNKSISEQEMEFVTTVSSSFNIPDEEFTQCLLFSGKESIFEIDDASNLLVIGASNPQKQDSKFLYAAALQGELGVLRIISVGIYLLRYNGNALLLLNGQALVPGKIYVLSPGSSIRSHKLQPIYYSDIVSCFLSGTSDQKVQFDVQGLHYRFRNGKIGLQDLSFSENSGKLIGIMGGSGAGKSTLLNLLNGNNTPSQGAVYVNGHNLHRDKKLLEGYIGYVPQDDLLIDEITVYQNLYYNSKLCFANLSDFEIDQLVQAKLSDLGLSETKDLRVGNALDMTISGGQRKRLNIALELIREPAVLFVDEPTSGLSSRDSENIMDLLKELALKGKLIFVVIHQPSSDIFKLFDKLLLLDTGGFPIYYGNPVEALIYFKTQVNHVNASESECFYCGNVNPEQVFSIIESKVLDENGNQTRERRISPKEWNELYLERIQKNQATLLPTPQTGLLNTFKKPNLWNQFKVFLTRNVLSKLSNTQYLLINLLEAPLLALLLALLIKYYKQGGEYIFYENKNMPAYLFMCVIVALFIGLTVSAEEIIRDRKIVKRESFLNLSKGSYIWSKIVFLFLLSALQTFLFVIIGNTILEIKGMYLDYWLVLFSTSCFANMLGLNISATFNSAVTIYIVIPILLIPQLLLSGVIVKFEELNPKISSQEVVPLWGEMMTSRWAFEALAVNQFINNQYESALYEYEKELSISSFKKVYWNSKMNELADEVQKLSTSNVALAKSDLRILRNEILNEMQLNPAIACKGINSMELANFDISSVKSFLMAVKNEYTQRYEKAQRGKDAQIQNFQTNEQARQQYGYILNTYSNKKIEETVKNANPDNETMVIENERLVATADPIFRDGSKDRFIRAQFFAPRKALLGKYYSTFWVNIGVIWTMSLILLLTLYFDVFKILLKTFSGISGFQFRKKE
ncbi:MAG TPA: ATP-binding cassette domain-containing protein [Bacteroidia bacterium]|nr:ATP-binding cassette domain-containing protein [Bacteroidia bacterium]